MASLSTQFHATIDELAVFVKRWITNNGVYVASVRYSPFLAEPLSIKDVEKVLNDRRVERLIFADHPVVCRVLNSNELLDKNIGALLLDVGRISSRGLSESHLSTMDATNRWRKISADLKKNTKAGVVGFHEENGATAKYRSHRYTVGAAELEKTGTALRPFPKSAVIFRPDLEK